MSEQPQAAGDGAARNADIDYILRWIVQIDECESIQHRLPENIRGLAKRALSPSAPAAAERVSGWCPIESAPLDGTEVLLHGKDVHTKHRKGPFLGSWSGDWPGDETRYWRSVTPGLVAEIKPTHWQPLPSPPSENQTTELSQ